MWLALHLFDLKRPSGKTRCNVFSQNRIDDGVCDGWGASNADAVAERAGLRSLLARPFYWLGYLAVAFLLVFLWSAEHVEGISTGMD